MEETILFVIPHAGGVAGFYNDFRDRIKNAKVKTLEYSGHGSRYGQPLYRTMEETVEDLYNQVCREMNGCRNYALFGHSMGAWVCYELYRLLRRKGNRLPTHLFISGVRIPAENDYVKAIHSPAQMKQLLVMQGGTPEELLECEEFLEYLYPVMEADYCLIENYEANPEEALITVPITVLGGSMDERATEQDLLKWRELAMDCTIRIFEGNHFYFLNQMEKVCGTLDETLR